MCFNTQNAHYFTNQPEFLCVVSTWSTFLDSSTSSLIFIDDTLFKSMKNNLIQLCNSNLIGKEVRPWDGTCLLTQDNQNKIEITEK